MKSKSGLHILSTSSRRENHSYKDVPSWKQRKRDGEGETRYQWAMRRTIFLGWKKDFPIIIKCSKNTFSSKKRPPTILGPTEPSSWHTVWKREGKMRRERRKINATIVETNFFWDERNYFSQVLSVLNTYQYHSKQLYKWWNSIQSQYDTTVSWWQEQCSSPNANLGFDEREGKNRRKKERKKEGNPDECF